MPDLVADHFATPFVNISRCGSSNREIFLRTLDDFYRFEPNTVIVQWSALRRHWFEPSLDTVYLASIDVSKIKSDWKDHNAGIALSKDQRRWLHNTLTLLSGDYKELVELALYCRALDDLTRSNGSKLILINGLLPWKPDLMLDLDYHDPGSVLSDYSKDLLAVSRLSVEVVKNYHRELRERFEPTRGLWVNQFESWHTVLCVDRTQSNDHPGPKSHQLMAKKVVDYMQVNGLV